MIATTTRKGSPPPGYRAAWVAFDEHNSTKPPKTYCYWTPPHWNVKVGDKLHVIVSERSQYKVVTVLELGITPMGAEHKIAKDFVPKVNRNTAITHTGETGEFHGVRIVENAAAGEGLIFHGYDAALFDDRITDLSRDNVMARDMQRNLQEQYYRAMAVPPGLLTPAKIRTLVENHAITLTQKEPKTMINMETITYLNGKPIKQATDAEMFDAIRKTEAEIKGLTEIVNKPKALKERMLKLQGDIDALVAYMDAR